jgi:hypothetical protein
VVVRWSAPGDHYRVVVDADAGTAAVVSLSGGVPATLWSGGCTLAPTGSSLVVEAIGTRLQVAIDGAALCVVDDEGHAAGQVGALSLAGGAGAWSAFAASFPAPAWAPWCVVPDADTLRSGSRLTVLAGRESDPQPAGVGGNELRFLGDDPATFAPSFPARGVDLRVVAPDGTVGHTTRFIPPGRFTSVPATRVVRRADGTAFVLVVPDGAGSSSIDPGHYRLTARFRRDNRAADPGSLVLTQQGEAGDEIVSIDIPWPTPS